MKKLIALIMALALLAGYPLTVLAETAETTNAAEMPAEGMGNPPEGGAPVEGMPGEPPEGGMPGDGNGGFGGSTPPGGGSGDLEYAAATQITEAAEASKTTPPHTRIAYILRLA